MRASTSSTGTPSAISHGSSAPMMVSSTTIELVKECQPALSPPKNPFSSSTGFVTLALGPSSTTVIVERSARSPSLARRCISELRFASRRDSSDSSETISLMVCALAISARTRSTLAWAVATLASRSMIWSVTSSALMLRLSSDPPLPPRSESRTAANLAAGTRSTTVAWDRLASMLRSSPLTEPPAPVAMAAVAAAAAPTSLTRRVMVPV